MFAKSLDEEIENQEIDKTRRFNKAQLNIKLDRFGGYDSNTDFYTFKTSFEKLHLQSTPRKLLPDLLKNNYLAEPALTLIETLDDIDTIWTRLKDAYGDAKVMLSRKLHEISKHDLIKTTNAEKLTTELGKVINMMLDTGKLAKDHHIEEHLYYGDGFTRICHLIGDRRTTKFLGSGISVSVVSLKMFKHFQGDDGPLTVHALAWLRSKRGVQCNKAAGWWLH